MQPIESEGRTVAEAVSAALLKSGLRRDQVEVSVIEEGSSGFIGLGAKPARVRLSEKRWGPDSPASTGPSSTQRGTEAAPPRQTARPSSAKPHRRPEVAPARNASRPANTASRALSSEETASACAKAQQLVVELLGLMSIAAPTASSAWDAEMERVKVCVESQDASLLIGRDGRVLESLQFLVTLMLSRGNGAPIAVQVDALSYWEKREQAVLEEAHRAAERVKATGKPVRMEPMDSSMRRLIHRTFSANPHVMTASEGEGPWRKLVVRPRQG